MLSVPHEPCTRPPKVKFALHVPIGSYPIKPAMAVDIHEAGSESPPPAYDANSQNSKKDDLAKETVVDVEGNLDNDSEEMIRDRAEATELTPVEAFKWNVEGDESPCKYPGNVLSTCAGSY